MLGLLLSLVWSWRTVMLQLSGFYCKGFKPFTQSFISGTWISMMRLHKTYEGCTYGPFDMLVGPVVRAPHFVSVGF